MMVKDDFEYILGRIDRMELSVASIVNKVLNKNMLFSLS